MREMTIPLNVTGTIRNSLITAKLTENLRSYSLGLGRAHRAMMISGLEVVRLCKAAGAPVPKSAALVCAISNGHLEVWEKGRSESIIQRVHRLQTSRTRKPLPLDSGRTIKTLPYTEHSRLENFLRKNLARARKATYMEAALVIKYLITNCVPIYRRVLIFPQLHIEPIADTSFQVVIVGSRWLSNLPPEAARLLKKMYGVTELPKAEYPKPSRGYYPRTMYSGQPIYEQPEK